MYVFIIIIIVIWWNLVSARVVSSIYSVAKRPAFIVISREHSLWPINKNFEYFIFSIRFDSIANNLARMLYIIVRVLAASAKLSKINSRIQFLFLSFIHLVAANIELYQQQQRRKTKYRKLKRVNRYIERLMSFESTYAYFHFLLHVWLSISRNWYRATARCWYVRRTYLPFYTHRKQCTTDYTTTEHTLSFDKNW